MTDSKNGARFELELLPNTGPELISDYTLQ